MATLLDAGCFLLVFRRNKLAATELARLKRQAARDLAAADLQALEKVLQALLPPIDDLARAIEAAKASYREADVTILTGLEQVEHQFTKGLASLEVLPIDPAGGTPFDPKVHEAVLVAADSPATPKGTVAKVYQRGWFYMPGNRLIRAARVAVAGETAEPRGEQGAADATSTPGL
jgi:molecular chaperone GrpE